MTKRTPARTIIATRDDRLGATIRRERPLHYADGHDVSLDRPAHIRAGSGVAWAGERLVIVQDDTNFLALVAPEDGSSYGIPLPAGRDNRRQFDDALGNKKHKLDLEAVASVRDIHGDLHIVALSSGSKRVRDTIAVASHLDRVSGRAPHDNQHIITHRRPKLYDMLRVAHEFSGSELNVEGAVYLEDRHGGALRLLNRGNGKARGAIRARNATADIAWFDFLACLADENHIPSIGNIVHYELGDLDACPLGFTDACMVAASEDCRTLLFTAAAEASANAVDDGALLGCAIGVIEEDAGDIRARWTPLRNAAGSPYAGKVEGIVLSREDSRSAFIVIDQDNAATPTLLCDVALTGPWF